MNIKKEKLKNGLTKILVPMKDSPTATVLVMVNAGTRFETRENNGVSHFLEHMCFKGTKKRPDPRDIATELDGLGAESNAFTWYEYTGYYAKTRGENASAVLDILADIYKNSLFQAKEIKKESGVITEEIKMYQDLPMRHVHDVFRGQLFGDQPAGWEVLGPEQVVQSLNRDAIVEYRTSLYVPEATTVIVVGGIDQDSISKEIDKYFGDISAGEKQTTTEAIYDNSAEVLRHQKKQSDQTHLVIGAPAISYRDDNVPALEVLSTVLGRGMSSRLFYQLRDQMGVCYYVRSGVEYYSDSGVFKVATGVDTSRVSEVVSAIVSEIKDLRDNLVDQDELEKAKEFLAGNFMLGMESTSDIANYVGEKSVLEMELKTPEEEVAEIQKVTRDDVHRVVNKLLSPGVLKMAAIGPDVEKGEIESILKEG